MAEFLIISLVILFASALTPKEWEEKFNEVDE